jgi:hypothetical protein
MQCMLIAKNHQPLETEAIAIYAPHPFKQQIIPQIFNDCNGMVLLTYQLIY